MEPSIDFFFEEIPAFPLNERALRYWINESIDKEGYSLEHLNIIFTSDEYLHKVNIDHLNHDTYTDIITFDNSEETKEIEGDIFISTERVRENAHSFQTTFDKELYRVIIHGVLHLCGYKDKTIEEKSSMREKENTYISSIGI